MEITLFWCASLTISFTIIFLIYKISAPGRRYRLPPSPAGAFPILGHLHLLKPPLHRNLHRLCQISGGPIISLKLGVRRAVVVSSPDLVEECFTKNNDVVFANRPNLLVDKYLGYNHTTVFGAPHGELWRSLRRIGAQEMLSTARLNAFVHIRQDEIKRMIANLYKLSTPGGVGFSKVELRPKLHSMIFNMIMRTMAGKRYFGGDDDKEESSTEEKAEGRRFQNVIREVLKLSEASNPQDFLPVLRWIDYGGLTKRMHSAAKEMDEFFQGLVDEHRLEKMNTMIGGFLAQQESQPQFYSDQIIKGFLMSILLASTDTSIATIEWAISLLLNHPDILKKAKQELDTKIGLNRLIDEDDLSNLPYLHNIILESLRLFPVAPLLMPHEASEDCRVGGYDIPRGTILLVNAWAIHRDPKLWEEATSFKPERFEGKEAETRKFMPFGMGRRACPGAGLAERVVGLALGSLVQCFELERVGSDEVDLTEGTGATMPILKPLEVMCKPREIMNNVIEEVICA